MVAAAAEVNNKKDAPVFAQQRHTLQNQVVNGSHLPSPTTSRQWIPS
jgi:hypothetical protein